MLTVNEAVSIAMFLHPYACMNGVYFQRGQDRLDDVNSGWQNGQSTTFHSLGGVNIAKISCNADTIA